MPQQEMHMNISSLRANNGSVIGPTTCLRVFFETLAITSKHQRPAARAVLVMVGEVSIGGGQSARAGAGG